MGVHIVVYRALLRAGARLDKEIATQSSRGAVSSREINKLRRFMPSTGSPEMVGYPRRASYGSVSEAIRQSFRWEQALQTHLLARLLNHPLQGVTHGSGRRAHREK